MKSIGIAAATFALVVSIAEAGLIYPETMQITDISGDRVTLETSTGIVYEMDGAEDYFEGDLVSCLMWSNGTEKVFDDVIVSARYAGYVVEE